MKFTGTLIEDLMATVERVEKRARAERAMGGEASAVEPMLAEPAAVQPMFVQPLLGQPMLGQPWFPTVQEKADYDSKFLGVA